MLKMKAVTMFNPATGWFEIAQYSDKKSINIANLVEQTWLSRCPWPPLITYDRGSEFIGFEFHNMVKTDYGIKCKPITVQNPQANEIVGRVHQVIGNLIRTYELEDNYLDENDPAMGWNLISNSFCSMINLSYNIKSLPWPISIWVRYDI